ncbi:hypothetical protein CANTEDRAFT_125282 [Yamadazyma tenuis ATCC 10573]|uniref:Natural resistance-associated macrophage protein n=1 Tax=Candida tenuis (strain ATCC 10573 / BCRC 21748 / CBS 615 / JCM 9827 / NBRC 10315 / NRRL Y-1498 / VKM Y-70) TaxID=590646 RepID=G3B9N0_CANTC|nr:uncharacterized protein CANTEDRAFT_125282 [Yamadazyma tenuis ATCC 10573]EGV61931.1 hypothetical protein CANTEDRAFT_125282 [Yamadazyma tenuis ATCC 10573]
MRRIIVILKKYSRFIGPGLMVSVAYMDPGNYSTAVAAGSVYQYKLLFSILLSNCLAIFLQILSARLGCVTGLDLATNCRIHLNHRINMLVYVMAEIAIIATDLAEVVGTAIALNILFNLPLVVGVLITIIDVLVVLMAYRPNGPLLFVRIFEMFVSVLVTATVICFGIELYQVSHDKSIDFDLGDVFKGFLPNEKVIDLSDREGGNGLFLSLAILGATVMPHSLYLGSGLVQSRLKDYDNRNGYTIPSSEGEVSDEDHYRPSIHAINDTMSYTIVELVISLFTVALFVNSAILIVAGATLKKKDDKRDDEHEHDGNESDDEDEHYENADLFTIYKLLSTHLSKTAGVVFALALLFSGQSAGIVCTLAGQMVSEGFLSWTMPPVARRLITRALAILPCFMVVLMTGREGLANVLNLSQVVLSLLLPFVTAPLIMFTCSKEIMRVPITAAYEEEPLQISSSTQENESLIQHTNDLRSINHPEYAAGIPTNRKDPYDNKVVGYKDLSNGPLTTVGAILVWGFITALNLFLIGSLVLGYDVPF